MKGHRSTARGQERLRAILLGTFLAGMIAVPANRSAASFVVSPGYDLFATGSGTTFAGSEWTGVPLVDFDFGDGNGDVSVGNTDTIVERKEESEVSPGPGTASTIEIEMVALQLRSVAPIDLGAGLDHYFITLQSGTPSTGEMTISFDDMSGGTFDSFIDVSFDIRIGSLDGAIVGSDTLRLSSSDVSWGREAPTSAVQFSGVNTDLNGSNSDHDFWADTPFEETHPSGAKHVVDTATVPAPPSLALFGFGGLLLFGFRRRNVQQAEAPQ